MSGRQTLSWEPMLQLCWDAAGGGRRTEEFLPFEGNRGIRELQAAACRGRSGESWEGRCLANCSWGAAASLAAQTAVSTADSCKRWERPKSWRRTLAIMTSEE